MNVFSDTIMKIFPIKFYQRKLSRKINLEMYNQSQNLQYLDAQLSATIQKFDNSEVININFRVGKIGEINQMKCCFLFIFALLGLMRKWYNFQLTSICFRSWNFAFQSHMVLRLFKSVLKLIVAKTRSRKLRY